MQLNQIQINDLYLINMIPYMIFKITDKTIFLKACRYIREEIFSNDQTFQNYNPDVYKTYLPEMVDDYKMTKILKRKFDLEKVDYDLVGKVYRNHHLQPEHYNDCEAFMNAARLRLKYSIRNELIFLKSYNTPNTLAIRLETISKLKEQFDAEPALYTTLINEISTDQNQEFFRNRPEHHVNYLQIYHAKIAELIY